MVSLTKMIILKRNKLSSSSKQISIVFWFAVYQVDKMWVLIIHCLTLNLLDFEESSSGHNNGDLLLFLWRLYFTKKEKRKKGIPCLYYGLGKFTTRIRYSEGDLLNNKQDRKAITSNHRMISINFLLSIQWKSAS